MKKTKKPWTSQEAAGDNFRGEIATCYLQERVHKPIWHNENTAVQSYLDQLPHIRNVLDVPFGTGRFVQAYLERSLDVHGVDISPDMIAAAKEELGELFERVHVTIGTAERLAVPDSQFDLVVCIRFLESIIPMRLVVPCLKEMRRVCNGHAIVRLNNRVEEAAAISQPLPHERMGGAFHLQDVKDLVRQAGWEFLDSKVVMRVEKKATEKRVYLLRAV